MIVAPNAIWFQSNSKQQAEISVVNDKYRYQVFCKTTGQLLHSGSHDTLREAKQAVFNTLEGD